MAAALVGTIGTAVQGTAGNAVTTLAFGTGESRTKGNTLICFVGVTGTATLPATPAGWEVLVQNAGTSCSATVFGKAAAGSDAAPTIGAITNGVIAAQLAEYSGVQERKDQSGVGASTGTGNITATFGGADAASAELMLMASADDRSNARAPNDTFTSNHITSVTQAGSNNGASSADHYSFAYGITNSNTGADTAVLASSVTTNITGRVVAAVTIRLGVGTFPNTFTADGWVKAVISGSFTADAVIKKTWGGADSLFLRSIGTEASGNTNSLVVNTTGNTGDIWIVVAAWDGTPTPNAPPAGWTQVTNVDGTNVHDLVWMRVGDGSSTVTIGLTGTANIRAVAFAYGPSNNGAGTAGTAGQTSGTSTTPSTVGGGSVAFSTYREIRRVTGFATRQGTPLTATGGAWGLPIYKSVASGVQFSVYDEGLATGGASTTIAGATWTLTSSDDWTVFRKFINNNNALGFTADAWIAPKFTADARIVKTISGSFSANAVLKKTIVRAPTNWTPNPNHPFNNHIRKTAWDGTTFVTVALAQTGFHTIATATDPEGTWTDRTPASSFDFRWVAFGNGVWVAVGADGSGNPNLYTATDPTGTWTKNTNTTFLGGLFYTVAYGNGKWVAGSNGHIYTATDPTGAWTDNTSHPFGTSAIHAAEYANGYWVASGLDSSNSLGQLAYATDPTGTWTAPASADYSDGWSGAGLYSIHYANGYWVVGGYWVHDAKVMVATDPTGTWTNYNLPFPVSGTFKNGDAGVFSSNGHTWVASGGWDGGIGDQGHIALTGPNPTTGWVNATDDGNIAAGLNLVRVFYANGYWIAVGDNSGGSTPGHMLTAREYIASADIKATISPTFTADAKIGGGATTVNGSFTANADLFKAGIAGSFTANADLFKTITGTFAADAVIKRTQTGTFTANADLFKTIAGTFTANADLFKTISGSFSANADTKRTQTGSLTADAVTKRTQAGSFSADADIKRTISSTFTANVVLKVTGIAGSFSANADTKASISGSLIASAVIKRTQTGSFSADAIIVRLVLHDTFTRTVADGLGVADDGTTYQRPPWSGSVPSNVSVDGSEAVSAPTTNGDWSLFIGYREPNAGLAQYDFWVPSDTSDGNVWYQFESAAFPETAVLNYTDIYYTFVGAIGNGDWSLFAGGSQTTFTPVGGAWYRAKFWFDHTVQRAKAWRIGDPEPDWSIEWNGPPDSGDLFTGGVALAGSTTNAAKLDNLYIWSASSPDSVFHALTADAVTKRTQAGSFSADAIIVRLVLADTFTRTVADGLGVADDGTIYQAKLSSSNGAISVDGAEAVAVGPPPSFATYIGYREPRIALVKFDFFVPSDITDVNVWYEVDVLSDSFVFDPADYVFVGANGDGTWSPWTAGLGLSVAATFTPSPSTWYTVKGWLDYNGTTFIKVWKRGDPEPDWQDSVVFGGASSADHAVGVGGSSTNPALLDNLYIWAASSPDSVFHVLTLDAVTKATVAGSFTAAADIKASEAGTFSANAVTLRSASGSITADATTLKTTTDSLSGAADIKATIASTFSAAAQIARPITADAVIKATLVGSFTGNAFVAGHRTFDAVIKATMSASFSANAFILGAGVFAFSADAVTKTSTSGSFTAAATIRRNQTGTVTGAADIKAAISGSFSANAATKRTQSATFSAAAVIKTTTAGSFTGNADLRKTATSSFTANAATLRSASGTFNASADIRKTAAGSFNADALLVVGTGSGSITANAVALATPSATLRADAVLRVTVPGSFNSDAVKRKTGTASVTAEAVIRATRTGGLSASGVFLSPQTGAFSGAAAISTRTISSFTADAQIAILHIFTADAIIKTATSGTISASAVIRRIASKKFGVTLGDIALIGSTITTTTVGSTVSADLLGFSFLTLQASSLTADAVIVT